MAGVSAFLWQSAALLLGAYFAGALIGCMLRRLLTSPPKVAMEGTTGAPTSGESAATAATAAAGAATAAAAGAAVVAQTVAPRSEAAADIEDTNRFGRALEGAGSGVAGATEASQEPVASEPPPEPAPEPVTRHEQPEVTLETEAESGAAASTAAQATAAAAATAVAAAAASAAALTQEPARAEPEPTPEATPDLTPAPPPAPQTDASAPLNLPSASGSSGQAVVAAEIIRETVSPAPAAPAEATPVPAGEPVAAATVPQTADDLTLIKGVSAEMAEGLEAAGVTRFSEIAAWGPDDIARFDDLVGGERRIQRENWIEQAQLLASGALTAFAQRKLSGAEDAVIEPTPTPSGSTPPVVAAAATATAAAISAMTAASAAPVSAPSPAASITTAREDLGQIDGINAEVQRLLHVQGVSRLTQIAGWTPAEEQRIDRLLGASGRVQRERWVAQAQSLTGLAPVQSTLEPPVDDMATTAQPPATADTGAATAGNAAAGSNVTPISALPGSGNADDAAAPRNSVVGLRSVRSAALVGTPDASAGDDLKRIRGVGVLIEKKLRAMGYTTYQQVANWTQDDVNRVSQSLDFRGRIERENWIEQARILAAGGQTEFSRRFERGEG